VVAEHLAEAMFMGRPDFARGLDGKWSLVRETPVEKKRNQAAVLAHVVEQIAIADGSPRDYIEPANDDSPRLRDMSFVVVDTETTGSSPFWGHRMTEFAGVVVERGEIVEVFESLVNPRRPIPSIVTALTGITSSMVQNAPLFREIAPRVESLLNGRVFVAHNATFDWRFVESEIANATGRYVDGPKLCTVKMAKRVLPNLQRRSLDHVANYCGVEIVNRHRAGGDAIATAHCLIYMLRRAESMGVERWTDLQRLIRMRRKVKRKKRASALPGPISKDTTA
jgi:DNA polymerase III epsilon subunit family exonuclease